jgi:predicted DNA-binding transcriptional regulator YafY
LLTKPLHPSQRVVATHPDGAVELDFRLIPNPELRTLLLGFGPDAEVLSPPALREEMAAQLLEALQRYRASG